MANEISIEERVALIGNNQRAAIERVLAALEKKYLSREKVKAKFLAVHRVNKPLSETVLEQLKLIDAMRAGLKTALQFKDYRRALRYLYTMEKLCSKFFA